MRAALATGAVVDGASTSGTDPRAVTLCATSGVALAVGGTAALDVTGFIDLRWGIVAAVVVITTGIALITTAFFGGGRSLIPVCIILALELGTTTVTAASLGGGVGRQIHRITDVARLDAGYELGIGRLSLDLRGIRLSPGETRIQAEVDVGHLEIVAPGAVMRDDHSDDPTARVWEVGGVDVEREIVIDDDDGRLVIAAHTAIGTMRLIGHPHASRADRTAPIAPSRRGALCAVRPLVLGGRCWTSADDNGT